jgi:hypothetical protein
MLGEGDRLRQEPDRPGDFGRHLGVVEHEQIVRAQQLRQIRYVPILKPRRCRYDQQARRLARLARVIGDPPRGRSKSKSSRCICEI